MSLSRKAKTNYEGYLPEEKKFRQRLRSDSLLETHPDLVAEQWDFDRNYWGPECFAPGSLEEVFWICKGPHGTNPHRFRRAISARTGAWSKHSEYKGCPVCAGFISHKREILAKVCPDLVREWLANENGCPASLVQATSNKLAQWQCPINNGHIYKSKVSARTSLYPQGCPQCYRGQKVDLSTFPQAFKLYDRTARNRGFSWRELPATFKVCWKCPKDKKHKWYESFSKLQNRNFECLSCHKLQAAKLADFPHLMQQIHPAKNGLFIHLGKLSASSRAELVWFCNMGHEWLSPVCIRVSGSTECPMCSKTASPKNFRSSGTDITSQFSASDFSPTQTTLRSRS